MCLAGTLGTLYMAGISWVKLQHRQRSTGMQATRKDWWDICDYVGWFSALHVSFGAATMCLVKAFSDDSGVHSSPSWTLLFVLLHPGGWLVGQVAYWVVCLSERFARNRAPRLHRAVFQLLGLAQTHH